MKQNTKDNVRLCHSESANGGRRICMVFCHSERPVLHSIGEGGSEESGQRSHCERSESISYLAPQFIGGLFSRRRLAAAKPWRNMERRRKNRTF